MLDIVIVSIGKIKESFWKEACAEYEKRLAPYVRLEKIELKAEKFSSATQEQAKAIENNRILKTITGFRDARIFLLDENGKEFDSVGFSHFIDTPEKTVFCIAGSLGWLDSTSKKYERISLSKFTFLHEMARVVLLEQIYRGISISNRKKYHY